MNGPADASDSETGDEAGAKPEWEDEGFVEISEVTGPDDTLYSLLSSNEVDSSSAEEVASGLAAVIQTTSGKPFRVHSPLKPESRYSLTLDGKGRFLKATLELDESRVFHAMRKPDGSIRCWKEDVVLEYKTEAVSFPIHNNLIASVLRAGEQGNLATMLSDVFKWDIDFQSELMAGDRCKILFERRYADDRPSGYGRILCSVFYGRKTGKKTAILFNGRYYDETGAELKRNLLRTPLTTLRVTSKFGKRLHPIHKVWRKHNGVDYGAPTGTPVWSVAKGVVTFAGWARGYGRYVCIRHDNGIESRYGHLSRMFVRKGQIVKQHQRIGLVGASGEATGPHLDFQLLVNGKHVDPLKVKMIRSVQTVRAPLMPRFIAVANNGLARLGDLRLTKQLQQ